MRPLPIRRRTSAVLAAVLAVVVAVGGVAPVGADATPPGEWRFTGSGWGHGVGLSQWGARNLAAEGRTATQILGHYYSGTSIGSVAESSDVRVLVGTGSSFTLTTGGPTTVAGVGTFGSGATLVVTRSGSSLVVSGAATATVASPLVVHQGGSPLRVAPPNRRFDRGLLRIELHGSTQLRAVIAGISTAQYLEGLGEVPASWPAEALKAQAVAARTIARQKVVRANRWDTAYDLDAALDGAYIGYEHKVLSGSHHASWMAAVDATSGQIVTYGGAPISAVYSASSGGHTEDSEVVWVSPLPYLRGVPDASDPTGGNPHASWSVAFSPAGLGSRLGIGAVATVSIGTGAGASGRLDKVPVTFTDTSGRTAVRTGAQLRSQLGLRSTRFTIEGATTGSGSSPAPVRLPIGALDTAQSWGDRYLLVGGRAGDPDGPVLVQVTATTGGRTTTRGTLATNGQFLDAWQPGPGTHRVCVTVFDNPTGAAVPLGCRDVVIK